MQEFIVDVDVSSRVLSRSEIASIIGIGGNVGWTRGDVRAGAGVRTDSTCRFGSGCADGASIEQHMTALVKCWPVVGTSKLRAIDRECLIQLRVAVLHDSYSTSFVLGVRWVQWTAECGLDLELSMYPTSFAPESANDADAS
jgi:hypothetical protein